MREKQQLLVGIMDLHFPFKVGVFVRDSKKSLFIAFQMNVTRIKVTLRASMKGTQVQPRATTSYGMSRHLESWKGAVKQTMVKQEALFQDQLQELHRVHRKQTELVEELKGMVLRQSKRRASIRKRFKKQKLDLDLQADKHIHSTEEDLLEEEWNLIGIRVEIGRDDLFCDNCHSPIIYQQVLTTCPSASSDQEKLKCSICCNEDNSVTQIDKLLENHSCPYSFIEEKPEMEPSTNEEELEGKRIVEEELARSAAAALVALSSARVKVPSDSPLLFFAKIVTSVRCDADLPTGSMLLPCHQRKPRSTQRKGQMGNRNASKTGSTSGRRRRKRTSLEERITMWGEIKNGHRSRRVPAPDPSYTFSIGAILCRWR